MTNKPKPPTSDPRENIWWDNLKFDVSQENLPAETYNEFLEAIGQYIKTKNQDERPVEVIVKALGEPPVLFALKGSRTPDAEPLSRVVDAESFTYNVKYEELFGLGTGTKLADTIWDLFKNGDIVPHRHFQGKLRSGRNFFWGTPTRTLEPLCDTQEIRKNEYAVHPPEKADDVATEMRNLLGLIHIAEGVGLYRIDIPVEILEQVKICAPTTLDSSPLCVFLPADKTTRYGWTLNLTNLQLGAEEVVVEPIDFTADFKVTQIGFVRGPLPNSEEVWNALETIVKDRLAKQDAN